MPDFGNFPKETNRYEAVGKMMPLAKGVSFKCFDFAFEEPVQNGGARQEPGSRVPSGSDGAANARCAPVLGETTIDMDRMMRLVFEANYHGWVGIEYEGSRLTGFEGVQGGKR